MRYYISDNHFFHERAIRMDGRPFSSLEEMNEYMLQQWNKRVRRNDEVVILGDLSFGNVEQTNALLKQLKGRLYLLKGNHDKWVNHKDADLSRFKWIGDYKEMSDNGRKVVLCHYPILLYNGQYRVKEDGTPKVYMLHGHVHNTMDQMLVDRYQDEARQMKRKYRGVDQPMPIPSNVINCFAGFSDYTPLTLDEWIQRDKYRREHIPYHGRQ